MIIGCWVVALALQTAAQSLEVGQQFFNQRKFTEARKQLSNIKDGHRDFAAAQYYLGRIAFEEKEYEESLDFFEEAVEANDKVADYHEWLGNAMGNVARDANMIRQGLLAPKMKAAWEKSIALDPNRVGPRLSLVEYYLEAPSVVGGSEEKAEATARDIIRLNPVEGHRALGNVYNRTKRVEEAEKEYREVVRLDERLTPVLANFYVAHQQFDKAFLLHAKDIEKNADNMLAHYQYGRTAAISGKNLDAGEKSLKKYLGYAPKENEPSHAGAYMRLAQISEKRGNQAEAKKLYELALSKDPTLKEAKEGLQRVKG
jgi:tetratricopeptide (TPR) repeat protein